MDVNGQGARPLSPQSGMARSSRMRDNSGMDPNFLREATRAEHEATEAVMPLMGPGLTEELYARVLASLWPIVNSWELWVAGSLPSEFQEFLQRRRRAPMLAADLDVVGRVQEQFPSPDWNAVVYPKGVAPADEGERNACVMGAMYVMEGSTLGGRFIARYVEEHLHMTPGAGDAYFRGHGEATGSVWREFRERLAAVPDRFDPLVEESAKSTFRAFGRTLQAGLATYTGFFDRQRSRERHHKDHAANGTFRP